MTNESQQYQTCVENTCRSLVVSMIVRCVVEHFRAADITTMIRHVLSYELHRQSMPTGLSNKQSRKTNWEKMIYLNKCLEAVQRGIL